MALKVQVKNMIPHILTTPILIYIYIYSIKEFQPWWIIFLSEWVFTQKNLCYHFRSFIHGKFWGGSAWSKISLTQIIYACGIWDKTMRRKIKSKIPDTSNVSSKQLKYSPSHSKFRHISRFYLMTTSSAKKLEKNKTPQRRIQLFSNAFQGNCNVTLPMSQNMNILNQCIFSRDKRNPIRQETLCNFRIPSYI